MNLSIQSEANDVLSLKLSGRVTQRNVTPYQDPLEVTVGQRGFGHMFVLDMSGVELLDSSGINWLLTSQKRVRESGGRLVLHSLSPVARSVIRVLNMQTVFTMADNAYHARELAQGEKK